MSSKNFELLEHKIQEAIQYIKELKKENHLLRTENTSLKKQYQEHEHRVVLLEDTIGRLREEHSLVEEQISRALQQLETLEDAISLPHNVDKLEEDSDLPSSDDVYSPPPPLEEKEMAPFEHTLGTEHTLRSSVDEIDLTADSVDNEASEDEQSEEALDWQLGSSASTDVTDDKTFETEPDLESDEEIDSLSPTKPASKASYPTPFDDEQTWNINTEEEEVPEEPEMF